LIKLIKLNKCTKNFTVKSKLELSATTALCDTRPKFFSAQSATLQKARIQSSPPLPFPFHNKKKMVRVFIVRHGETEWNTERRWQGQGDSALTSTGVKQARAIGRRLSSVHQSGGKIFSAIYSSDLGRCVNTARIIADEIQFEDVTIDSRLRERSFGIFEGKTRDEAAKLFPGEVLRKNQTQL
jgi:hypothetical protein